MRAMVKCAECGFLCFRQRPDSLLVEADEVSRSTGKPALAEQGVSLDFPVCFARAYPLRTEADRVKETGRNWLDANLEVIRRERDCASFARWRQGYSPKEHSEMIDRQWMLDWQRKTQEEDRAWREQTQKEDREWRREERRWRIIELVVMGGIVTLVMVAAQIVAAFIQAGK